MSSFFASAQAVRRLASDIALAVEREAQLAQIGAGQIARALDDERESAAILLMLSRTKVVKLSRKSSGSRRVAVSARDGDDLVGMVGDRHKRGVLAVRAPVENRADPASGGRTMAQVAGCRVSRGDSGSPRASSPAMASNRVARLVSCSFFKRRRSLTASWSRMAVAMLHRPSPSIISCEQAARKTMDGLTTTGFIVGDVLQMRIEIDRVENAEHLLADLGATAASRDRASVHRGCGC